MTGSWVYFIRAVGGVGPVKIGWSKLPESRLAALMVWSPQPLEIAARIEGGLTEELRFHALFKGQHSHNEWFHPSDQLDVVIGQIARGEFDMASLPEPARIYRVKWTAEQRAAASMRQRVDALERAGVELPLDVKRAARRYGCGHLHPDYPDRDDAADMALVQEYLKDRWRPGIGGRRARSTPQPRSAA